MIIRKNLFKNQFIFFVRKNENWDFKDRVNINYELLTKIEKTYDDKFKPYIYDKQNLYIKE